MTTPIYELGDLVTIRKGKKAVEVSEGPSEGFLRYIQIEDLRNNDSMKYARNPKGPICDENDVLIAWDGAKAGTVGFGLSGLVGSTIAILKPNESVYPPYLGMVLQSKYQIIRDACTGATIPHVSKPFLTRMKISLPSISEQKRIAAILGKADEIRKKSVDIFPLREEAIMSIFQEKFGDTKLNPKGWPLYPLKEIVCDNTIITRGIDQPGENNPDGIPFIRPSDFGEGISRDNLSKCATEIESRYVRSRLDLNDIVITIRATVGTTLLVNEELVGCNLSRGTARISPGKIADSVFLLYCLRSEGIQRSIQSEITGTTFLQISLAKLREIKIPIPPMNIQETFRKAVQLILSMPDSSELSSTNFQAIKQQLLR